MAIGTGIRPVSHAGDLVPDCSGEDALAARHEEPHGGHLGVPPGQAVEAVDVAAEGGAAGDHLVPVAVQGAQQDRGDVHGDPSIPCQQRVHQRVFLLCRFQITPAYGQFHPGHVLFHLVPVYNAVVEVTPVPMDAVCTELDNRGKHTPLGRGAIRGVVPIRPDGLLPNLAVHLWQLMGLQPRNGPVEALCPGRSLLPRLPAAGGGRHGAGRGRSGERRLQLLLQALSARVQLLGVRPQLLREPPQPDQLPPQLHVLPPRPDEGRRHEPDGQRQGHRLQQHQAAGRPLRYGLRPVRGDLPADRGDGGVARARAPHAPQAVRRRHRRLVRHGRERHLRRTQFKRRSGCVAIQARGQRRRHGP
mmetsp:Transcript_86486/g.253128  ORF Transcript_86486/g.253128 Transcript_86486/m.253128 type:complete len:360 (+) Transcript_86486:652-1731(+)